MRRFITYIVLTFALVIGCGRVSAQELKLGADFTTLFDNKEYAGMEYDTSGTLFSARLTPKVGVVWSERNELQFAADLVQDFGHRSKFLSDVNVQLYYAYRAPRVKLFAGIFPRSAMRGLQSSLFFDRSYRYYHNRIGGILARYTAKGYPSYVEFAMDYTGMRDFDTREAFAIMSSGEHILNIGGGGSTISYGYDFYMGHYAKDNNPDTADGVVDNIMLTPFVRFCNRNILYMGRWPLNFDVRLRYVQSLQRDRINENVWEHPFGGELFAEVEWAGLRLANTLYMGRGSLFTYYGRYGAELYSGHAMYRTDKGIYDAIQLSYKREFFSNTVSIEAGITAEYSGAGWGTRQWIVLDVNLDYGIKLKREQQYID